MPRWSYGPKPVVAATGVGDALYRVPEATHADAIPDRVLVSELANRMAALWATARIGKKPIGTHK